MPGHFTIVFAARPAAIWVCSAIANVIRSASGASSAGAPVTFGVGHGVLGVGIGASTGVDAVGLPVVDGVDGPLEPGAVDGDASGLLSEQDDNPKRAKKASPKCSPVPFPSSATH